MAAFPSFNESEVRLIMEQLAVQVDAVSSTVACDVRVEVLEEESAAFDWDTLIDAERRLIYTTVRGAVNGLELRDHEMGLVANPCYNPTFTRLIDLRHVQQLLLTEQNIQRLSDDPLFVPTARRALVANDTNALPLAVIYGIFRDPSGDMVRVFRTIESAWDWLRPWCQPYGEARRSGSGDRQ